MKNSSKIISILFLIGGLGIIIAAYLLFLKEVQEEKLFYLNLIATCLVYAVVFLRTADILGPVDKVAQTNSAYGLKWFGVWVYTPLALGLIVCSIVFELSFNICLIGHITLLFVLLLFFFIGSMVKNNVNEVISDIEARKVGLKEIATQIDLLEMQSKLSKGESYQDAIDRLRANVRFITASDKPSAVAFDNKLIEKIQLIASQIANNSQSPDIINEEFEECMSIIELRKKQY